MAYQMEILKGKIKVENDDMNDAEILMDYAEMAKGIGDMEAASWFHRRAKSRWSLYEEAEKTVDSHIERMRTEGKDAPDSVQAAMLEMFMEESKMRAVRLCHRIEKFSVSSPERGI